MIPKGLRRSFKKSQMHMTCLVTVRNDGSMTNKVRRASVSTNSAKGSSNKEVVFSSSMDLVEPTSTTSSVNSLAAVQAELNSTLEVAASISSGSSSKNLKRWYPTYSRTPTSNNLISVQFSSFTEGKRCGFYTFSIQSSRSVKISKKNS